MGIKNNDIDRKITIDLDKINTDNLILTPERYTLNMKLISQSLLHLLAEKLGSLKESETDMEFLQFVILTARQILIHKMEK